jgi:hypothetical protein
LIFGEDRNETSNELRRKIRKKIRLPENEKLLHNTLARHFQFSRISRSFQKYMDDAIFLWDFPRFPTGFSGRKFL